LESWRRRVRLGGIDGRSGAGFGQGEENGFGGDVADESVAGEGQPPSPVRAESKRRQPAW